MNRRTTIVCVVVGFALMLAVFYGIPRTGAAGTEAVEVESLGHDTAHTSVVRDADANGSKALRYELPSVKDGHTEGGEIELSSDIQEVVVVARAENGAAELEFKVDGSQKFEAYVDSSEYAEYRGRIAIAAGVHDLAIRAEGLDSGARLMVDQVRFLDASASADSEASASVGSESPGRCTLYAAKSGSDSNTGTESDPLGSVQNLLDSLEPGQTGCLKEGVYTDPDDNIEVGNGGVSEKERVTLRNVPGERATINARLYIPEGTNYVTVRDLLLDGSRAPECSDDETCDILPSIVVNGDHTHFLDNEVTNRNKGICFNIGAIGVTSYGTVIRRNKVHDCGRIPRTNFDHGIYLDRSRDTVVADNWIYDNADRGIQLRTDADNTLIERNVIDGNGQGIIFSGNDGEASSDTTVTNNLITNSEARYNVESWYPAGNPVGERNVVVENCIHGGAEGNIDEPTVGYTAYDNLLADPTYKDRANGDFTLQEGGPCRSILAD